MCDNEEELPTSAGEELKIFAETTSLVGLAHVVGDRQRWARIFWAFAFMGALAAALYQVAYLVQKFRRFEVATEISYQTSKFQAFPWITICNLNPIQENKIWEDEDLTRLYLYYLYPDDFNETEKAELFGKEPEDRYDPSKDPECLKWGFNYTHSGDYDYDYEDDSKAHIDFDLLTEEELEEYERCRPIQPTESDEKAKSLLREKLSTMKYSRLEKFTQSREEMIISCVFNGTQCSPRDFRYVPSERYGRCIQFPRAGSRFAKFTGPAAGLELLLFLNTKEYSFSSNIGARVEIHPPKTSAYPYENGFYVSAGSMTSIAMRKLQLMRMGWPYGKCINISDDEQLMENYPHIYRMKKRYNLKTYSVQDCESICRYEAIKAGCNCRERVTPFAGRDPQKNNNSYEFCQPEDRQCVHDIKSAFSGKLSCGNLNFPSVASDQCPNACSETTYNSEISASHYPSDKNFFEVAETLSKNPVTRNIFQLPNERERKALTKSWYNDRAFWDERTTDEFEDNVRHDLVRVRIFYKILNYELIKEKPNYEFINLVSDLGGNTGLWVGFCVLTLVEWIVLVVNLAMVFCCGLAKSGRSTPAKVFNDSGQI